MSTTRIILRNEAEKISKFISEWQGKNPYNGDCAQNNELFRKDFNEFLISENISELTKSIF